MKWSELYSGLHIREQNEQPDCDIEGDFIRMLWRGTFLCTPFHIDYNDDKEDDYNYREVDVPLGVKISQAIMSKDSESLKLTCTTFGVLPPGIVHGTYVFTFEGDSPLRCEELPAEMFEDDEVPEDEFSNWVKG